MNSPAPLESEATPCTKTGQAVAPARTFSLADALDGQRWMIGMLLLALDVGILWGIHQLLVTFYSNEFIAQAQSLFLFIPLATLVPILYIVGGYDTRSEMRGLDYSSEHVIGVFVAAVVAALAIYTVAAYGAYVRPSRGVLFGTFGLFLPASLALRWLVGPWVAERTARKTFLVLGSGDAARSFFNAYQSKPNRQRLVFVDPKNQRVGEPIDGQGSPLIEGDAVQKLLSLGKGFDGVIVAVGADDLGPDFRDTLVRIHFEQVPVYTLETFYETQWKMVPVQALNPLWPLQMGFQFTREYPYTHIKRLFDIIVSGFGLILLAPIILLVALVVLVSSGRPIIFRQARIGRDRAPFTVLKFRTMRSGSETGSPFTIEGDARITPLGRWLRLFRLDELPQLWNVLRGDMSLIGPRAESAECVMQYEAQIPSYHLRHLVAPGITGWAQVNYRYGAGYEDAVEKLKYDLYYIRHHSLLLDAMIVLKTVYVMIAARGR